MKKIIAIFITIISAGAVIMLAGCSDATIITNAAAYDVSGNAIEVEAEDYDNFFTKHGLSDVKSMPEDKSTEKMADIQVLERIDVLGVDKDKFSYPQFNWKSIYNDIYRTACRSESDTITLECNADTASEVNRFIENKVEAGLNIVLTAEQIVLDEPIRAQSNITIDFSKCVVRTENEVDFGLLADRVSDFKIVGFGADGNCDCGIYVIDSKDFVIDRCTINHMEKKGIALMGDNENFAIRDVFLSENGNGGLFIDGNAHKGVIEDCVMNNNYGTSNQSAGIVLAGTRITDKYNVDNKLLDLRQKEFTEAPNDLILINNYVTGNNSSGIYSYYGYCNYYIDNTISGNDKEGMCLDFSSFGNYLTGNKISENGLRGRQTDTDLEKDFILELGRLEDGSSPAKVPGISIDNAAYNIIYKNRICDNYGSGIKIVRSGYRNTIIDNDIIENNKGCNDTFHFFGINLGFAEKPDFECIGLNFTPPYENIVCGNRIGGKHFSGIFLDKDSYYNSVFDNTVTDATGFSIECHSEVKNLIYNNSYDGELLNLSKRDVPFFERLTNCIRRIINM